MSVNFSTITPMNPSTISKQPAYTTTQPASSPVYGPKKKSHKFRNTVLTLIVLGAAAGLTRKFGISGFDKTAAVTGNFGQKALGYGKKAVAYAGDFVNKYAGVVKDYAVKGYNYIKGKFTP
jgi:hypothetical protein